jgi:hypothetical protein
VQTSDGERSGKAAAAGGCDGSRKQQSTSCRSLRKHEPRVHQDVSVVHANEHAVHANLAQAANGQHTQRWALPRWRPRERPLAVDALRRAQVLVTVASDLHSVAIAPCSRDPPRTVVMWKGARERHQRHALSGQRWQQDRRTSRATLRGLHEGAPLSLLLPVCASHAARQPALPALRVMRAGTSKPANQLRPHDAILVLIRLRLQPAGWALPRAPFHFAVHCLPTAPFQSFLISSQSTVKTEMLLMKSGGGLLATQ